MNKRVVVTGIGVLSSNGIGKADFFDALFKGVSGIKPVSLFDVSSFKAKLAGEIKDFMPQDYLGQKGLRTLDRSTKLICSAAKLALDDANLAVTPENTDSVGVCIGNTLGSVSSISDFDKEALLEGVRYVNPALFPNTVINSPASQVSIKFNIQGFNTTISTGFSAGLDAIGYAADFIRLGRAKAVLAGAVEELCIQLFLGFYKKGFLAGLTDSAPEISCPFDKRRNGIILGEGAGILILEDLESARERKANIYGEVLGYGSGIGTDALKKAMRMALSEAKVNKVDFICAGANSTYQADLAEADAIKNIFGKDVNEQRVSAIKSMVGECYSATGSLQAIAAVAALDRQAIPPMINYQDKDPGCDLNYVANEQVSVKVDKVLVNAFGVSGGSSSLVVGKL